MKFARALSIGALAVALESVPAVHAAVRGVSNSHHEDNQDDEQRSLQGQGQGHAHGRPMSKDCTVYAIAGTRAFGDRGLEGEEKEPHIHMEEEFVCELDADDSSDGKPGRTVPLEMSRKQRMEMSAMLNDGTIVSGRSAFRKDSGAKIVKKGRADRVVVPPIESMRGKLKDLSSSGGGGGGTRGKGGGRPSRHGRGLAQLTGDKHILVVIASAADAPYPYTAANISGDVFSDEINMRSQFYDCSFGQLNILPTPKPSSSINLESVQAAPGVIEVNISPLTLFNNTQSTIRSAINDAAAAKLGITASQLDDHFDHVVDAVEFCDDTADPGSCGWAAYAYINSWNSMFQGAYIKHVGVQMHELGHNLNFAHSGGLNMATYTDHTCMMGNPLYSDTVGKMCFNPAKNFQIDGWYNDNKLTVDPRSAAYVGPLVGIADHDKNTAGHPEVIKIETGTATDLFVGFNRAAGVNAENDEADDEVTVVETGNNGLGYSQSYLKATLLQGESYKVTNWQGTGQTLEIKADSITLDSTGSNPSIADVSIKLGCENNEQCDDGNACNGIETCDAGTCIPGTYVGGERMVELELITDNYPSETSWELRNPSNFIVKTGSGYTSAGTAYADTIEVCPSSTGTFSFTIRDTYGDGICCSYGSGSYKLMLDGAEVLTGGAFASSETQTFEVLPVSAPSPPPVSAPTPPPVPAPTLPPVPAPTPQPTTSTTTTTTTAAPTANPTPQPTTSTTTTTTTAAPTANPTPQPTTSTTTTTTTTLPPTNVPTTSPPPPPTATPTTSTTTTTTTPAPTPCVGKMFKFEMYADDYPSETSWDLKQDGVTVLAGNAYGNPSTLCCPPGDYVFTVNDSWGDGICCGWGVGNYTISLDDDYFRRTGGAFGSSETTQFTVGADGLLAVQYVADSSPSAAAGPGGEGQKGGAKPYSKGAECVRSSECLSGECDGNGKCE